MTARLVRRVVIAVSVVGIAGMVVGSIADNNAVALTFGLIAAAGALCLIVATAVTADTRGTDDAAAQEVELLVGRLVASGADEGAVRDLVGAAVRMGRGRRRDG